MKKSAFYLLGIFTFSTMAACSSPRLAPLPNDYQLPLQRDNKAVYLFEQKEVVPGADPETFQAIQPKSTDKKRAAFQGIYFRDKDQVFFFDSFAQYKFIPLSKADPESFENLGGFFGRDKNHAYFHSEFIPDADPKTFQPLLVESLKKDPEFEQIGYPYSRDATAVFYGTKKIPGADPKSFEILSITTAKDKNRSYRFPESLKAN